MAESISYFSSELSGTKSANWIFKNHFFLCYVNNKFLIFKNTRFFSIFINPKENQESLRVNWKSILSKNSI